MLIDDDYDSVSEDNALFQAFDELGQEALGTDASQEAAAETDAGSDEAEDNQIARKKHGSLESLVESTAAMKPPVVGSTTAAAAPETTGEPVVPSARCSPQRKTSEPTVQTETMELLRRTRTSPRRRRSAAVEHSRRHSASTVSVSATNDTSGGLSGWRISSRQTSVATFFTQKLQK